MTVMANERPGGRRGNRETVRNDPYGVIPRDPLERDELAKRYGYALNVIYSVPELRDLFEEAFSDRTGQWTTDRFQAELQDTDWYRENDYYARVAFAQEQVGGADWEERQNAAREQVRRRAGQVGARLTAPELDALTRRFIYEGWGESGRDVFLDNALAQEISYLPDERGATGFRGAAGNLADQLRLEAAANGLRFSDTWYQDAARSVTTGDMTADDWVRDIREQAAGRFQPFADKIRAGQSAYSLASPYINRMADILEINPEAITLDDPYISRAIMGVDGQAMPLWDFEQQLRKDPRWLNTNRAQNDVTGIASAVMQMFGLRG